MVISKKVQIAINNNKLVLHKEGIFYKSYNEHAMHFLQIKRLKVQCKWFKNCNQYVYIVGFPVSVLQKLKNTFNQLDIKPIQNKDTNTVHLVLPKAINTTPYLSWKEAHKKPVASAINTNTIITRLVNFQVSNHTPLEAMLFLVELQNEAKKKIKL